MSLISLNPSGALSKKIGGEGIQASSLQKLLTRVGGLRRALWDEREPRAGFLHLPEDRGALLAVERISAQIRPWVRDIILVGIGGSSLGNEAIFQALCGESWNILSDEARRHRPRFFVLDNPDPMRLREILPLLRWKKTLAVVISKSGGTLETLANYFVLKNEMRRHLPSRALPRHFLFVTGNSGFLREEARRLNSRLLEIPENVGGRFSVLSAVGLSTTALLGLDARALLSGARKALGDILQKKDNPASILAALQFLFYRRGKRTLVFMPYASRLRGMAFWFRQLWAESLGKRRHAPPGFPSSPTSGRGANIGPLPVAALGAVDQHSQLQLYLEGPNDKLHILLQAGFEKDVRILQSHQHLSGHTLGDLLRVELLATAMALAERKRPCLLLTLRDISEESLGALFLTLEMAVVLCAGLFEVNPFDQPAVESGKEYAREILARD